LLSTSYYFIGQTQEINKAKDYYLEALSCKNLASHFSKALTISKVFDEKFLPKIKECLEIEKNKLDLTYYYITKSDIDTKQKNYDDAIRNLKKSFDLGLPIKTYLTNLSFIYLKMEKYDEVLKLKAAHNAVIEKLKIEPVTINIQKAAKESNSDLFDATALRNLSAQSKYYGVRICAFSLLDNDKDAKRLIKYKIELSNLNYYEYIN
jgi:predicted Zn-dependent protease